MVYTTDHPVGRAFTTLVHSGEKAVLAVLAETSGLDAKRRVSRLSPAAIDAGGLRLALRYDIQQTGRGECEVAVPVVVAHRGADSFAVSPVTLSAGALPAIALPRRPNGATLTPH